MRPYYVHGTIFTYLTSFDADGTVVMGISYYIKKN